MLCLCILVAVPVPCGANSFVHSVFLARRLLRARRRATVPTLQHSFSIHSRDGDASLRARPPLVPTLLSASTCCHGASAPRAMIQSGYSAQQESDDLRRLCIWSKWNMESGITFLHTIVHRQRAREPSGLGVGSLFCRSTVYMSHDVCRVQSGVFVGVHSFSFIVNVLFVL